MNTLTPEGNRLIDGMVAAHDDQVRAAERERCAKAVSPAAVFEVLKKHFTAHDRLPNIAREISALLSQ